MTLVAALLIEGVPTLIGDALVTGNSGEDSDIIADGNEIPTIPSEIVNELVPLVAQEKFQIYPTRLKLSILNNTLVVGWTGTRVAAQAVIQQLALEAAKRSLNLHDLEEFFECYAREQPSGLECELLGWLVDEGNPISFSWSNTATGTFFVADLVSGD